MFYCFNTNCNRWGEMGETVGVGILLYWPMSGYLPGACPDCGHGLYHHDSWNGNRRYDDAGKKIEVS